jgi:hypothetical protein
MRERRLVRCLPYLALLSGAAPGCQAFYSYRPVSVLVRDAETKKPVPGAEVHISYPLTRPSVAPYDSSGTAGDDGVAHLRAAPFGEAGLRVEASARGYLPEALSVPVQAVDEIPPAPLVGGDRARPVSFVLEVCAGPSPTVELVVPNGFRGLVKAEVQVREDAPCPPGQRCFRYQVEPSGYVLVTGPPLLRRVFTPDYQARFADGTPISRQPDLLAVGFRPLKAEPDVQYFVVGTQSEFDTVRRMVEKMSREMEASRPRGAGSQPAHPRRRRGAGSQPEAG